MSHHYILEGKKAVPTDLMTWAKWSETREGRIVKQEMVFHDVKVSTVFLGLDHQFGDGPPLLFETLVFGGKLDGEMDRYTTWEEAEKGHADMVKKVKEATK